MESPRIRVRFAPSPTGNPHLGNFRTALYNYLFARHNHGEFLLRIEDTDRERSTEESLNAIFDSLRWMGLESDEEPYFQSNRLDRHQSEVKRLLNEGHAYLCRCTPEELEERRQQQIANKQKPMYDRRCREKNYSDDGTPSCIRLRSPDTGVTVVNDLIRGDISVNNEEIDDLILVRTDGSPTYNLAVVVDDHDMGITHVIRGDDHLNNTIRQVAIFESLGYELPTFAHLPQILGPDKTRLSKRHGATGVLEYRAKGYLPEALVNYLARLGWAHGDQEFFLMEDLIKHFELEHVNKSSAIFDPQKLEWLNGEHIRHLSVEELSRRFIQFVQEQGYLEPSYCQDPANQDLFLKIAKSTQERSRDLCEMFEMVSFLFKKEFEYPEKDAKKLFKPEAVEGLQALLEYAEQQGEKQPTHEDWEEAFKEIMEKQQIKMRILAQAVRLALTGTKVSPPIFDVIDMLGLEGVKSRLKMALNYAQSMP